MRTSINEKSTETAIAVLSTTMDDMKNDLQECKKSITEHAEKSLISNQQMNDTVAQLQFSVNSIQSNLNIVQADLMKIIELSKSFNALVQIIKAVSRIIFWVVIVSGTVVASLSYLGYLTKGM